RDRNVTGVQTCALPILTTGIAVGEARGAALVAAARYTQELYEYTPMQVKQAVTGTGRADKTQVQAMVRAILGMREIPKPDDAAEIGRASWRGRVGGGGV